MISSRSATWTIDYCNHPVNPSELVGFGAQPWPLPAKIDRREMADS